MPKQIRKRKPKVAPPLYERRSRRNDPAAAALYEKETQSQHPNPAPKRATRLTHPYPACHMYGTDRKERYPGFLMCNACDIHDSQLAMPCFRSSYKCKCTGGHTSFVRPTTRQKPHYTLFHREVPSPTSISLRRAILLSICISGETCICTHNKAGRR